MTPATARLITASLRIRQRLFMAMARLRTTRRRCTLRRQYSSLIIVQGVDVAGMTTVMEGATAADNIGAMAADNIGVTGVDIAGAMAAGTTTAPILACAAMAGGGRQAKGAGAASPARLGPRGFRAACAR